MVNSKKKPSYKLISTYKTELMGGVKMAENPEEEEVRLWEDASVPWPDSWQKHRKP